MGIHGMIVLCKHIEKSTKLELPLYIYKKKIISIIAYLYRVVKTERNFYNTNTHNSPNYFVQNNFTEITKMIPIKIS